MKLYVCGAKTGNPDDWSEWDELSIVLAEDERQAGELSGKQPVFEVDMSRPAVLVSQSEPNLGDDL